MRVGAGILHYRGWPEVGPTIDGLLRQSRQPDEILVVDHASGDGSAEQIRAAYPQLEMVELAENRGPSGGMRKLLEAVLARGVDAAFVLPHDIELASDVLELLAARLEEVPELGAVGPLVAHQREPELIFYAGGYVDPRTWDLEFREEPRRVSDWKGKPPQRVEFLELGGLLVRAEAAREAGPIPEHYYYHYEDVDFTLRLGSLGWKLECVPAAVAWQDLGGDPSRATLYIPTPPYLRVRNRLSLIARNAPRRMLARELLRVVYLLARDAIRPPDGTRADLKPRLRGLFDFCRGHWGAPPT
jgi:GT2 family glycosyltransferase